MEIRFNRQIGTTIPPRLRQRIESLAQAVAAAGGRLWIVGGAVRDALRGEPSPDYDAEVYGIPEEELEKLLRRVGRVDLVGRSFAVWKMKGMPLDVALPRRERADGPGHKDFTIEADPFLSLELAARRRDFTINALLWDPLNDELADPTGGLADLESGLLRHTSDQFAEDPLRVLRAMQFVARFELSVAPETLELCRSLTPSNLPPERLFEEWRKLIVAGRRPSLGLRFLRDVGWLRFFPELEALIDCPQDPQWHPEGNVWEHTAHCMDAFARSRIGDAREDLIVGLAVLCHDLGKPATTALIDGRWRAPRHEAEGEHPTRSFLARLTRETALIEAVVDLVTTHMRPHQLYVAGAGDGAVRRLAVRVGRIDRLVRVAEADARGRPPEVVETFPAGEWLLQRAKALTLADRQPEPLVKGRHLMPLGVKPSREMGQLIKELFELQLDGVFSDLESGLQIARQRLPPGTSEPDSQ